MKNMEKYWKEVERIFDSSDDRKIIRGCYAIGFILIAISIFMLCVGVARHEEFTFERMSFPFEMLAVGLSLVCLLFYRKKISNKIKFYLVCLFFTCAGVCMFFHPHVSRRIPSKTYCRVMGVVCSVFFGGGGLWILCNDCKWYLKRKNEEFRDANDDIKT